MVEVLETNSSNNDKNQEEKQKLISFEILRLIKEAQQHHGLRHGDYQRYHGYCSRRIRRLRKTLKLPQAEKRHYKKREVTESHLESDKADERYLELQLMLVERSWAYAMQLRQEANTEPRKRFHLLNRLRKSVIYATHLENLSKCDVCDARTKLEVYAYKVWIIGTLNFELENWNIAAENFSIAEKIYKDFSTSLPQEEQAPYKQRCEELIPSLRYCMYNIKGNTDEFDLDGSDGIMIEGVNTLMQQAKKRNIETYSEIQWRGQTLIIRSEQIRLFLLNIERLDENLKKYTSIIKSEKHSSNEIKDVLNKCIEFLEAILMECKDLINLIRDEIKNDPKLKADQEEPLTPTQLLLSYLTYIRLNTTIKRNLYLIEQSKIEKKSRAQDIVRFLEIILQHVQELRTLPGFDEDDMYIKEIDLKEKLYKSLRCFYIAKTLEMMKRYSDAYWIYERSMKYTDEGEEVLKTMSNKIDDYDRTKEQFETLKKDIVKSRPIAHANAILQQIDDDDKEPIDDVDNVLKRGNKVQLPPLEERLDEYVHDPNLLSGQPNIVQMPPALEPIPCKPLFFDLASNYIEFPDLSSKLTGGKSNNKQRNNQGLSSFVKGLWGWGEKK